MENNQDKKLQDDVAPVTSVKAEETWAAPVQAVVPKKSRRKLWVLIIVVVFVLALAAGAYLAISKNGPFNENNNIKTSENQALFLTNGQVYFGHLSGLNHKYVMITDIFYLQVQQSQSLQQGTGGDTSSQVSLAKLGNELHGPEDKMFISSDQVLFWENLKPDGKVSQAIAKYQNK